MFGTLRQIGGDQRPVPEITAISSIDYEVAIFSHCLGVVIPSLTFQWLGAQFAEPTNYGIPAIEVPDPAMTAVGNRREGAEAPFLHMLTGRLTVSFSR